MGGAAGEEDNTALRVTFDPRLKLEFHGSRVTSDAGLLPFRDLDDVLGLTDLAGEALTDTRTGQNSRHTLIAQRRQSVFGRLAGYGFCQGSRQRLWPTRARLGIGPLLTKGADADAVLGMRVGSCDRAP